MTEASKTKVAWTDHVALATISGPVDEHVAVAMTTPTLGPTSVAINPLDVTTTCVTTTHMPEFLDASPIGGAIVCMPVQSI
ncbi:hypothetical protein ACH5RR_000954 [Cinchona calisaya]|uniref:Glyceraldehyde-3-phosphate dehydrogenase n=1 Tax=Cinchona calisaya TaxID=153742 RepID=A0ABD3B2T7_9GENT